MIVENYPVYSPVKDGLAANYTINFGADLNHFLPLGGMFQGDPVKSKSLYVNNYNNAFSFSAIVGNDTVNIPAYRDGYIDVSHVNQVIFQSNQPGSVTVTVYDYANPVTDFSQRGVPPGQVNTTLPCNDNISQGDIVTLGADGFAYWANDPNATNGAMRPVNQTSVTYNYPLSKIALPTVKAATATYQTSDSCQLSNGNIAFVYIDANGYPNFTIYDNQGNQVVVPTQIAADSNVTSIRCIANGNNFAVFHANPAKITIYDNFGNAVSAPQLMFPNTVYSMDVCVLNNGNFAVICWQNASYAVFTSIFSSTGVQVIYNVSLNNVDNSSATTYVNPQCVAIAPTIANNSFVYTCTQANGIGYYGYFNGQSYTLTQISSTGSCDYYYASCKLSNGNVAIAYVYSAAYAHVLIFSGSGALLYNVSTSSYSATMGASFLPIAAIPDRNGGLVLCVSETEAYFIPVSATGTLSAVQPVESATGLPVNGCFLSNGNFLFACVTTSSGTIFVGQYDTNYKLIGTVASAMSIGPALQINIFPLAQYSAINPSSLLFGIVYGSATAGDSGITYAVSNIPILTPMGVAIGPASPGQNVTVQISGTAQTRLTFKQNYTINAQSQTPPGQKMAVIGNAATMQGIQ